MMQKIAITQACPSRLSHTTRETAQFGTVFSDHMLVANYQNGVWDEPAILPYGPLPLPPAPSALHYGQTIFEGFKVHRTVNSGVAMFRPRDNHIRLNQTAARLVMPSVPESLFLDGIAELIRLDRDWIPQREGGALYVRPVYFAMDESLQVRPSSHYRLVVMTSPVGPYFAGPVNLVVEERYVRAFPGGTGEVKPAGNYAGSLLASYEAQQRGYHNVIWLDGIERRFVEECGLMNIFFVIDGMVVTPPLTGTILPGITRDSIITLLRDLGITVEERLVAIEELFGLYQQGRLSEAAGVGTAATVVPIGRICYRDREIDLTSQKQDSIMERARIKLEAIRTGQQEDTHKWLMNL
ncbi:MAG: branched-chain amino acid aminotransferase [Acidobacteriota bacterium]